MGEGLMEFIWRERKKREREERERFGVENEEGVETPNLSCSGRSSGHFMAPERPAA